LKLVRDISDIHRGVVDTFALLGDKMPLADGTERLYRTVGKQLPAYAAYTFQKSETSTLDI